MTTDSLVGVVKEKIQLVRAHAPEVVKTGVETLRAARGVVTDAQRELKRTLKEGVEKMGHEISHLASMTHKEQAEAKKAAVKAKKHAKRAATHDNAAQPAA